MNCPEREAHIQDVMGSLDFVMCGGLQGLAELLGQNDPNARLCETVATGNYPRGRVGFRDLFLRLRFVLCDRV
jgi:hypothetical protein